MTIRHIVRLAGIGALLLGGWTATAAAQSKVLTLDGVPKRQAEDTLRKAPADQVFELNGTRITKAEVLAKAQANHERFAAEDAAARTRMSALGKGTADRIAKSYAARQAELDAENAKGNAAVVSGIAAARKAE
jgi:hypothetical protein